MQLEGDKLLVTWNLGYPFLGASNQVLMFNPMHLNQLWLILIMPFKLKFDTEMSLLERQMAVDEWLSHT